MMGQVHGAREARLERPVTLLQMGENYYRIIFLSFPFVAIRYAPSRTHYSITEHR